MSYGFNFSKKPQDNKQNSTFDLLHLIIVIIKVFFSASFPFPVFPAQFPPPIYSSLFSFLFPMKLYFRTSKMYYITMYTDLKNRNVNTEHKWRHSGVVGRTGWHPQGQKMKCTCTKTGSIKIQKNKNCCINICLMGKISIANFFCFDK